MNQQDHFNNNSNNSAGVNTYHGNRPVETAMGFMEAVKAVFNKYADFSGRSRRSEYWYFYLFHLMVILGLVCCAMPFMETDFNAIGIIFMVLMGLYGIATIIPFLALIVRRLHDVGQSGWMYLVALVPFVGGLIILYFMVTEGQPGPNQWGPNPKLAAKPTTDPFL